MSQKTLQAETRCEYAYPNGGKYECERRKAWVGKNCEPALVDEIGRDQRDNPEAGGLLAVLRQFKPRTEAVPSSRDDQQANAQKRDMHIRQPRFGRSAGYHIFFTRELSAHGLTPLHPGRHILSTRGGICPVVLLYAGHRHGSKRTAGKYRKSFASKESVFLG
jgi:hypothetical protein